MTRGIADRLLPDRITIRKPVQSMVPGSRRPVFEYQAVATGVKARFNPASTALQRNTVGQVPRKGFRRRDRAGRGRHGRIGRIDKMIGGDEGEENPSRNQTPKFMRRFCQGPAGAWVS